MANKEQVRVSPNENGWRRVHKSWSSRDIAHFDNKDEAVNRATDLARNQKSELKIQKRDGRIHGWNSYGSDPFPPRDRR